MMAHYPITLEGRNLGQRHRHLSSIVADAIEKGLPFHDIEHLPEQSPVDRLFKIDLASKLTNVDYIIQNLKDDDMLYVSRALKATWLLNDPHRDIINPEFLERALFPQMLTTAITKMKHWLYTNLKDPQRCSEFYQYYKEENFDFAIKFLYHCNNEYLLDEFPTILTKITPHRLKVFSEKCFELAKLYYDALETNNEVARQYRSDEQAYFNSVKCLLKINPDLFRDIMEKYYQYKVSPRLSEHIMKYHKDWFTAKPELYTACLLHIPTLAKRLSSEESAEVVVKLARAKYLSWWFSYNNVEPLVKRLSPDRRAAFKKRVFVDKDIGQCVEEWPYPIPCAPPLRESGPHTFDDPEQCPDDFNFEPAYRHKITKRCIKKKKYGKYMLDCIVREKTELDRLFDEYRFAGFDRTFFELSRRLGAVSSPESRRNIFMVLVSKTGGRPECVSSLFGLLARHINETPDFRAAIIRSLVRRACVWRLPSELWTFVLKFGHGLGLHGSPAEAECREGMHSVVLRQLLADNECDPILRSSYLIQYTTFSEYSLTADERSRVRVGLTKLLIASASESKPDRAAELLNNLLKLYTEHRVRIDADSAIVSAVKELANRDAEVAKDVLHQLYSKRVARKELFLTNLNFIRNDAGYVNVLRHNSEVLPLKRLVDQLTDQGSRSLNKFFRKLALYFNEDGGLAGLVLDTLNGEMKINPDVKLVRPLVTLIGRNLKSYLESFDDSKDDVDKKRIGVALRANAHHARPKLDIDSYILSEIGAKAMATKSLVCRSVDVVKYVNKLLTWRRTVRIGLLLARRAANEVEAFTVAVKLRPQATLKAALLYFHHLGDCADLRVWDIVKPLVLALDLSNSDKRLLRNLTKLDSIPEKIRVDYCAAIFMTLSKTPDNKAVFHLYGDIEKVLLDMNVETIESILFVMLSNNERDESLIVYPSFFVKYLLLCETEEEQNRRLATFGQQFMERIENLSEKPEKKYVFEIYINKTLECLKYSRVFFDNRYVSCLPLMEKIVNWIKKLLPTEEHFKKCAEVHLSMLYFKAVRQSVQQAVGVFSDPIKKATEGVDIVGATFGRYIARELHVLVEKYFDSIIELYKDAVIEYLDKYFVGGASMYQLVGGVVKGILEESIQNEGRLAMYVLENKYCNINDAVKQEIEKIIKGKNDEIKFLYYGLTY